MTIALELSVASEMSVVAEWLHRVTELRAVAERTEDPHLRYKLFSLADRRNSSPKNCGKRR